MAFLRAINRCMVSREIHFCPLLALQSSGLHVTAHTTKSRTVKERSRFTDSKGRVTQNSTLKAVFFKLHQAQQKKFAVVKDGPVKNQERQNLITEDVAFVMKSVLGDTRASPAQLQLKLMPTLPEWPASSLLAVSSFFFQSGHNQAAYISRLLDHVSENFEGLALSPEQVTHVMFLVFHHGSAPGMLFLKVEDYVLLNVDGFSLDELAIICLGFFRGNKRIKSHDLLDKLGQRLLSDFDQLDLSLLQNFMKAFRHAGYARVSFYENLADLFIQKQVTSRLGNLNSVMHVAMMYACNHIYHEKLFQDLVERFLVLLDGARPGLARSKDVAKFVWALGTVQHSLAESAVCECLLEAYRRQSNLAVEHPESLADLLMGLAYLGHFPHDLITAFFQPDTVVRLRDHAVLGKIHQLLLLHACLQIEHPDSGIPGLSQELLTSLLGRPGVSGDVDFELGTRKGLSSLLQSLTACLPPSHVHCHCVLPHFPTAGIELQVDKAKGQFVEFEPEPYQLTARSVTTLNQCSVSASLVAALSAGNSKPSPSSQSSRDSADVVRVCIEVAGGNQVAANDGRLLGSFRTKVRHLNALGFSVLVVSPDEATAAMEMTETDRRHFLSDRLRHLTGVPLPAIGTEHAPVSSAT